jgi:putative oxidoreductase
MKIVILAARILLGLMFFVFGLNGILMFLPMPVMPPSDATTFSTILMAHKYMTFVALLQVIGGLLLLVGRFVPLGLVILGPILVNILLFHITLQGGAGIAPGAIGTLLELFLIYVYRLSFRGLFDAAPEVY